MNYKSLFSNIAYRELVKAVKNDYHILEGKDHYVVLSTNYQYKIVEKKATKFIVRKLGGKKSITVSEVFNECKGSKYFTDKFDVLNALYALAGTKQGKISKIGNNKLFFNVWKGR